MHVLLIGPRASGKSSTGRQLAARLDRPFVDLDDVALQQFTESTVVDVWSQHGEPAWRQAEVVALGAVLGRDEATVVALGGGTPMIADAQSMLRDARTNSRAFIVYLRADAATLIERLRSDRGDRPSLTGEDVAAETAAILEQRGPRYEATADFICDTDECNVDELAVLIDHELRRRHG